MAAYRIVLKDRNVEIVDGADAYQQEGQMTTFFQTAPGRQLVDSWSTRLASFRTSEVVAIRRLEPTTADRATDRSADRPADRPVDRSVDPFGSAEPRHVTRRAGFGPRPARTARTA